MSTVADPAMKIESIAVKRIHADEKFNCRGYIPPSDVIDLAKDIEQNTLQQPITVQPYDEIKRKATGFDFRIIQGHRRFTAVTLVLKRDFIPCIIREGLSEQQALIANLGENLQRKALNIIQEARAVERLKYSGLTVVEIAKALRVERSWLQTRFYVLDFPSDIQDEIANGMLTQPQIHEIHAMPREQWYEAVRTIKEAKIRAGTKRLKVSLQKLKPAKTENLLKAKPRKPDEVDVMLDHLMDTGMPGLHTRALAWVTGRCTTLEFLQEYRDWCKSEGVPYHIPTEGIAGL